MTFQDLQLIAPLLKAVAEEGYTTPSPIQQKAIPPVLAGRDLVGCAQTGTGKTAAFALPILQRLCAQPLGLGKRPIRALVLTPTRELAIQILESFQAGLSWECILNKREAFVRAFDGFELDKVCAYGEDKLAALQQDPGIVRNRLKIHAAVNNARIFREIKREWGSFARYLWHWTDGKVVYETGRVSSGLSDAVSRDLKRLGMKFVGTVIIYAYLQAVGVINSHEDACFCKHRAP